MHVLPCLLYSISALTPSHKCVHVMALTYNNDTYPHEKYDSMTLLQYITEKNMLKPPTYEMLLALDYERIYLYESHDDYSK